MKFKEGEWIRDLKFNETVQFESRRDKLVVEWEPDRFRIATPAEIQVAEKSSDKPQHLVFNT